MSPSGRHAAQGGRPGAGRYKLFLSALKYIPAVTAFCYMLNTLMSILGHRIEPLSNVAGMSLVTWAFMYLSAELFCFCLYHRLLLWYVFVDDTVNIIDYYWTIPVTTDRIIMVHNVILGVTVFLLLGLHVHRLRQRRKTKKTI